MNHMKFKDILKGLSCRFILVMESEYRGVEPSTVNLPPRFTIGGSKASLDPKMTKLSDLVEISSQKPLKTLPVGVVHQFIYQVNPSTDEFGWQYRSKWSDGVKYEDEQWAALFDEKKHFVRRRLWFTSLVNDIMRAKQLLHSELTSEKRTEVIAQGLISFLDLRNNRALNDWQRMKILLRYDAIEVFVDDEAPPIGLALDNTCKLYMLSETNSFGQEYVFKLRNMDDSIHCIIGFDSDDDRLNWLRCIEYQIAILHWGLTFSSFTCGPPTEMTHIVLSGDLFTIDNNNRMHFQLKPTMLLAFEKENLVLRLNIEYAVVHDTDDGFIIEFISGYVLRLRSDLPEMRDCWVSAIRRQILHIESNYKFFDSFIEQSDLESKYRDRNWNSIVDNNATQQSYLKDELQALIELSKTEYYDGEMHAYIAKMNQSGKHHPNSSKTSIRAVDMTGKPNTTVSTSTIKNIYATTLTSNKAYSTTVNDSPITTAKKEIDIDKDRSTVKEINNKLTTVNNYSSMLVERSLVSESMSDSGLCLVTSNDTSAHPNASTMKSTEESYTTNYIVTQSVVIDDVSANQLNASENILAKKDMSVLAPESASDVVVDIVASDTADLSLKKSSPIKIEAPIRTPLKSPSKSPTKPVSFNNENEIILPIDSYESFNASGSMSLLISTPESTNSPYSKPIDFLSVTTVGDHLTPPRSPYASTKSPSAPSQSFLPPSTSSDYTPVDEEITERNIVRRRSKVFENGSISITSEKQLDSSEVVTRVIVSEKVKAFNERSMGSLSTDRSDVSEAQVITRSAVAEKAKLFDKGNNLNDQLNDNSELNQGRRSKIKKEKGSQDRWNKAGPGSIDTNYTNYTNYNFESPDASISRSIVSERLKIFGQGNNSSAVVSPRVAADSSKSKSSKLKSSTGNSIQSTAVEVKVSSNDVSRDIEESARSPTIVNEVRAVTAVVISDSFETTQSATSSDIVVQAVETPTAKPTESALPIDTAQGTMIPKVVLAAAGKTNTFNEVTVEETSKTIIMESSTKPVGKSTPSLLTPNKNSSPVNQLVPSTGQVRALDKASSGVDDKISSPSATVKLATNKPLVRHTPAVVEKPIVDPMNKLSPIKTQIKPAVGFTKIVDKSTSDVVQPNEKPSSDAYKPTVIRRFEKISTAQTVSSSVAVATTTTSTTTAKVMESRMSRLSSARGNTVLEVSQ